MKRRSFLSTLVVPLAKAQSRTPESNASILEAVWQGARVGLISVPLFLAVIPLAPWLFRLAGHEPELAKLETLAIGSMTRECVDWIGTVSEAGSCRRLALALRTSNCSPFSVPY